jgi:hypothetical protein
MEHLTDNDRNKYTVATWILVGIVIILQFLDVPSVQIIILGVVIAIQYKTRSLSKLTLAIISVAYLAISVLWMVGL